MPFSFIMELAIQDNFFIKSENQALLANTIVTGISVLILINAEVAVVCMVVNVAFSLLAKHQEEVTFWFRWDNKAVQHLKNYWKISAPHFKCKFLILIVKKLFLSPTKWPMQTVVKIFIDSLSNPYRAIWMIFRICVLAPIVEEVIFRGFLQEKIRNIQVVIFGANGADHIVNKTIRVGIQAILFGYVHIRADQEVIINRVVFVFTGVLGAINGYLKETTGSLWCSIAHHAHVNISTTAFVLADHFLPYYHAPAPDLTAVQA